MRSICFRYLSSLFLIILMILPSGCIKADTGGGHKVVQVVDGDTMILSGGRKIRLLGIDTPEIRYKIAGEWVLSPEPFALEAKEYAEQLIRGRVVDLEFDEDREDKYGRSLAYVLSSGKMVNRELVRSGMAMVVVFPPNDKYLQDLLTAQKEAQAEKIGIWSDLETVPPSQAAYSTGHILKVQGRVAAVEYYRNEIRLTVMDGSMSFRLVIFRPNLTYFTKAGIVPESYYPGREICATGKVLGGESPYMRIYYPEQIEVLSGLPAAE